MKRKHSPVLFLITLLFSSWKAVDENWIKEKHKDYNLLYTSIDKSNNRAYNELVANGIASVKSFFHGSYKKSFDIFIHPSRNSLDSTWKKDWKMPEFKSECWMVASGVAARLDMISPKLWDKESCDHIYAETLHTQQLITHELVHVYHGQCNVSPDFSNAEGIDWFVEGLATFASGQLDASRIADVKKAIAENKITKGLDNFWTGKIKYGLSGSVVMYIDHHYGRSKLKALLSVNKKSEILSLLKTTETELLNGWKDYMQHL